MRDPERIKRILELLEEYWTKNPDLRLAQIVGNIYGKAGDPYQMEDDKILDFLIWNRGSSDYVKAALRHQERMTS